ncbi:helix-turn-helix domain-containing protein [bacterium]|nr:helix-turn-helix domain-containing protein [bacterium]
MQSPLMRIAWLVRERRTALRVSQREVAARVGCSQSYVAQVESR